MFRYQHLKKLVIVCCIGLLILLTGCEPDPASNGPEIVDSEEIAEKVLSRICSQLSEHLSSTKSWIKDNETEYGDEGGSITITGSFTVTDLSNGSREEYEETVLMSFNQLNNGSNEIYPGITGWAAIAGSITTTYASSYPYTTSRSGYWDLWGEAALSGPFAGDIYFEARHYDGTFYGLYTSRKGYVESEYGEWLFYF